MKYSHKISDSAAMAMTKFFRFFADTFFAKRYGHRAVVLETIAGVPGMVGGMFLHMRSLRKMERGNGTMIHELLAEAENERKHLMFFIEIAKPNWFERMLVLFAQFVFWHFYFVLYVLFPKVAHRMVGYFEEQAVVSYTQYLEQIDSGKVDNIAAPQIAIDYYNLSPDAKLRDVVIAVREDERGHSEVNHGMANTLIQEKK